MKFGLIFLGLSGAISVIGSLIPQGNEATFYENNYSSFWSSMILALKFDDIYHAWYFVILFGALCLSLLLCSVTKISGIMKRMTRIPDNKTMVKLSKVDQEAADVKEIFKAQGFNKFKMLQKDNNKIMYYSKKHRLGYLGSWFIHVGVLLTIVFYGYGQIAFFSTNIYGVPGEIKAVQGTDYQVDIQDFYVDYREDGSVEQYTSNVELINNDGKLVKSTNVYVNKPMRHDGYAFYQTATGWATDFKIYRGDELIKEDIFYESTGIIEEREEIAIQFTRFFPDFRATEGGIVSVSSQPNNPKVLYTIFFRGHRVAMGVAEIGETINWYHYNFVFDNPRMYTYLHINKMPGKIGAMVGSLLIMVGLFLCFYMKPKEMVVMMEGNRLVIFGNDKNRFQSIG